MAGAERAVALVGPTAVGKSAAAVALAALRAPRSVVVLNGDAMQLYRGMDVGTAKVDAASRAAVPHRLLDLWPVTHRASVVEYRDAARAELRQLDPAALPILVGGSGLYLTAVLDDLQVPATDPVVRDRYERRLADSGPEALHEELARRDPAAAAAIEPANGRRLVRALEVVELTGSFRARLPRDPPAWLPTLWVGLAAPMAELDRAIDERVADMWRDGLVEEVSVLAGAGLREGPTASKAVGYQECLAHLDGELTRSEAIAATARRTRQLARRQLRWFRRDPRITWLDAGLGATGSPQRVAERVADLLDART